MPTLLERAREINKLIQENVKYETLAEKLSRILDCNTYIVASDGELLGYGTYHESFGEDSRMHEFLETRQFPEYYMERIMKLRETEENVDFSNKLTIFPEEVDKYSNSETCIIPIFGAGDRLGTLVVGKKEHKFNEEDLVLCEYSSTVVGMEMMNELQQKVEKAARDKASIAMAIRSLSYSEREAIEHIFEELGAKEGLLVASKVADRVGITRSVIVNALRKLESAGVIESRSLGMKGTFIRVKKEGFLKELEKEAF
ncbi:MAG TPA: GTP-sensing pleiotropic transcriptional regulator CodY [Candidatus Nosocomiicoccus stercorigallinarum]|nr:GTP-sensing pleiotropic transcriptional regulator CodY [Candidatus Nosocomiicoccus stercorigallinarum]